MNKLAPKSQAESTLLRLAADRILVLDGAMGSQFLADVAAIMEEPALLLD